jgi:hypothetical protein
MALSKLARRRMAAAVGLLLVFALIAEAQIPGRERTRRVEGERDESDERRDERRRDRRPQREIPRRTESRTPNIDLRTGTFELRREIFRGPPRRSPRRVAGRWRLGIWTDNAPAGLRIREVSRYSPAWRFGLEEGDYLMDVMGYPVGFYEGAYYPLAETLNQVTPPDGWINILVWNKRSNAEETMWMQAEPRVAFRAGESGE